MNYMQTLGVANALSTATRVPVFNHPLSGAGTPGAASEVTQAIVSLIQAAQPDATIRIAMYRWADEALPSALVETQASASAAPQLTDVEQIDNALISFMQAGGRLQVVVDDRDDCLYATCPIGLLRYSGAEIYPCSSGACHDPTAAGIQHNKFILINNIGAAGLATVHNTVFQMTSNWTNAQLNRHFWNSGTEFFGDADLYSAYNGYWNGLKNCATGATCTAYPSPVSFSTSTDINGYFFPISTGDSGDPIQQELGRGHFQCPGTEIDVAVNEWSGVSSTSRGYKIEKLLADLNADNCVVRIVVQRSTNLKSTLTQDFLVNAHCTDSDQDASTPPEAGDVSPAVHSKYMLVGGTYDGTPGSTLAFTGSETFGQDARDTSDNTWLALRDPAVYAAYQADFDDMFSSSPPCIAVTSSGTASEE